MKPLEVLKMLLTSEMPELGRKLRMKFTPGDTGEFFLKTFLETIKYRQENAIVRNDLVSLLLELKDTYTNSELAAEAFLVYTGGFETSSSLISFVLYELAIDQEVQERLRNEVKSELDDSDGKLTYDMLHGFKYLDMVVQETLRKFPPLPNLFRKATKDYHIPEQNLVIPKGTSVIVNTYSLHHDAEYFPEPEKFDPERFSEENIGKIKQYAYLPFGEFIDRAF
jgi:cytochrome P450 family 6